MQKSFFPVFHGMTDGEIKTIQHCLRANEISIGKGQYVWHAGDDARWFGVVVEGKLRVVRDDILGNRLVITNLKEGQVFGESFSVARIDEYPVSVQADEDSKVILFDRDSLTAMCRNTCGIHKQLIDNILSLLAHKNLLLNNRIHCVTKRTTRDKILYYLTSLVKEVKGSKKVKVTVPYNREDLANYLGVNRSALSRELSNLKEEGILEYNKNKFILCLDLLDEI